ncbi:MAG: DNA repair and recombination protein RadA [Promethearchaeota archaeon]
MAKKASAAKKKATAKKTKTASKKSNSEKTETPKEEEEEVPPVDEDFEFEFEEAEKEDQEEEKTEKKSTKSSSESTEAKGAESEPGDVGFTGLAEELDYGLQDLPGVGTAIAKKLAEAGFESLQAIATAPVAVLVEEAGLGEKTAEKVIKAAHEALNIGFRTADVVWEARKRIARLKTGSEKLDELIGGGIETGSMTEFFGEFRTGKTQIMHQLCVNAQLPREEGGLEGAALYIDTESTFRPERIIQMAEAKGLDPMAVLKNIVYARAFNSDHQILLVKEARKIITEMNVKLLVVDSIIGHYRSEFIGRGTLAGRQQSLNLHLHTLQRLAETYNIAVVFTNQVQAKPDVFFGDPTRAAGGHVLAHGATLRLYLRKGKGEQRICRLIDSPNLPEGEVVFAIRDEGICDVD